MYNTLLIFINYLLPHNKTSEIKPADWSVNYTIINFTKCNVPFSNKLIIKPLYDKRNKIIHLIGISYNNIYPVDIYPIFHDFDSLVKQIENSTYAISLTIPFYPFIIQYVNKSWTSLFGHTADDVIGNTFKCVQSRDFKKESTQLSNIILSNLT